MSFLRSTLVLATGLSMTASAVFAAPMYNPKPNGIYYMIDLNSGAVLFDQDAERRMLPASMAKMMTAYVAFDLITHKKLSLDDQFVMPPELWKQWSNRGSTMFIKAGQSVSVADLLHGVITLSGNDASALLVHGISGSEAGFTTLMNEKAKDIGLSGSHFANAKGWPDGGKTYSTARDLGTIAERTLQDFPDLYKQFYATRSFRFNGIEQPNRNPILDAVKGADGLKTGHTEEAGYGFTGTAIQDGRRLIMVVGGMGSSADRVSESIRFLNWGFAETRTRPLFKADAVVGAAAVQGGDASQVELMVARNTGVTYASNEKGEVTLAIRYKGPLRAPIEKHAHVADLVITGTESGRVTLAPLYTHAKVEQGNFIHRIRDGFFRLFN